MNQLNEIINATNDQFQLIEQRASALTLKHFGKQRMLFNPIYLSNICINDCAYCGYRKSNHALQRRTLNSKELLSEVAFLINRGVHNILLLAGEFGHKAYLKMILQAVDTIKNNYPSVWLGLEAAPLEVADYQLLKKAGVDSIIIFQESYSRSAYAFSHGNAGPKSNFEYRREALDRAVTGGFREVGLGVLYGLADAIFETVEMHKHADELIKINPDIRLRFSFPRIQKAEGQDLNSLDGVEVSEALLYRLMVATRLAYPEMKIVLTARESQDFRLKALNIVTEVGEEGSTVVGGYTANNTNLILDAQFKLSGLNSLRQFKQKMEANGFSWGLDGHYTNYKTHQRINDAYYCKTEQ